MWNIKIITIPVSLIILSAWQFGNSTVNAQVGQINEINEVVNKYDPILSKIQYSYRIWLENLERTYFANEDLFSPNKLLDSKYLNHNIDYLLSSIDYVKFYLHNLAYVSTEYGDKLKSIIDKKQAKASFETKWRNYQEGVALVMSYDIKAIIEILDVFIFIKENQSKFEVEDDMIYFYDDEPLSEYEALLNKIIDQTKAAKQEATRVSTVLKFNDAIDFARKYRNMNKYGNSTVKKN